MAEKPTDTYFTNANKVEEYPGGIIVQAETDASAWEPWKPYLTDREPGLGSRLYKGRWYYCVGVMPWRFAMLTVRG